MLKRKRALAVEKTVLQARKHESLIVIATNTTLGITQILQQVKKIYVAASKEKRPSI